MQFQGTAFFVFFLRKNKQLSAGDSIGNDQEKEKAFSMFSTKYLFFNNHF